MDADRPAACARPRTRHPGLTVIEACRPDMRVLALLLLLLTAFAFGAILVSELSVHVVSGKGLANPSFHFELTPGSRELVLAGFLAASVAGYAYALVVWAEHRFQRLAALLEHDRSFEFAQPPAVRNLKNAIRSGDATAIRRYARRDAFADDDPRFFTPVELAELYGDEAIIAMVREAARKARR